MPVQSPPDLTMMAARSGLCCIMAPDIHIYTSPLRQYAESLYSTNCYTTTTLQKSTTPSFYTRQRNSLNHNHASNLLLLPNAPSSHPNPDPPLLPFKPTHNLHPYPPLALPPSRLPLLPHRHRIHLPNHPSPKPRDPNRGLLYVNPPPFCFCPYHQPFPKDKISFGYKRDMYARKDC